MGDELFERAEDYDAMLDEGIRLSGQDKAWFIDGRLRWLAEELPDDLAPARILDFACGTGDTTAALAVAYPGAEVVGAAFVVELTFLGGRARLDVPVHALVQF